MAESSTDRRTDADEATDFEGGTVNVLVGSTRKLFCVHEKLLRANSAFFEAALKKEWIEGQSREVKLPEEDPTTFRRYVHYLYSGMIACKGTSMPNEYCVLTDLYVLGERLLDHGLRDTVLNAFIAAIQEDQRLRYPEQEPGPSFPSMMVIDRIYTNTAEGSPARRLMVDLYVVRAGPKFTFERESRKANTDFLLDLAKGFAAGRSVKKSEEKAFEKKTSGTACAYHDHEEGEPCSAKRRKLS